MSGLNLLFEPCRKNLTLLHVNNKDSDQSVHSHSLNYTIVICLLEGAQWLSGRVLDLRPKGHKFEPHRRHCVVILEQDTFILA